MPPSEPPNALEFDESVTVARMRGDEFAVLFANMPIAKVKEALQNLLTALRKPLVLDDVKLEVSVVIGVSMFPHDGIQAVDLIRHIEHAINVAGEDHVGIGTDTSLAPMERTPQFEKDNRQFIADMVEQGIFERGRPPDLYMFIPDLNTADRYEKLAALLAARGHSDARIAKILGGNFARVLREVWGS